MIYLGCDCGVSGAIAIVEDGKLPIVQSIPLLPKVGQFNRHDQAKMWEIIRPYVGCPVVAVIEHVRFDSRDDKKKGSAETLVRTHEAWLTLLTIAGFEVHDLEVPVWRKWANCRGLVEEKMIVTEVLRRYPKIGNQLKRRSTRAHAGYVYDHDRAEALLMVDAAKAIYAARGQDAA